MEQLERCKNPSQLLYGLLDTIEKAACILDDDKNLILNKKAQELSKKGLDLAQFLQASVVSFKGTNYYIRHQDINHGTKSKLFIFDETDEAILKLTESSKKLRQVLSAL